MNEQDLENNFRDLLDEMLDAYGTETVLFRLQKRLEGRMETHDYGTKFIPVEIAAIKEALIKIGEARYRDGAD